MRVFTLILHIYLPDPAPCAYKIYIVCLAKLNRSYFEYVFNGDCNISTGIYNFYKQKLQIEAARWIQTGY